ncbi:hypothetical protein, conserved [Plasmodium vivax]|nr:hypothetical protein, conserved [Plasmodium vivax]
MSESKANKKLDFFNFIYNGFEDDRPTKKDTSLEYILKTDDAYLRNVALYLRIYYEIIGRQYFNQNIEDEDLCKHLNIWLNEKKVLYTSGGSCSIKNNLWENYIENIIWDKLRGIQLTQRNIRNSHNRGADWCRRDKNINNVNFHTYWVPETCTNPKKMECACDNKEVPQNTQCPLPPVVPQKSTCDCSHVTSKENIPSHDVQTHQECPPTTCSRIAPTTGYILFAITIFSIILCKFTPIGSLLNGITGKKKRPWENNMNGLPRNFSENYFNSESPNNQERMNNLFYPSMRN